MAPDLPKLGPRARNAFGQRTGPGLAADMRDGITVANILEDNELILENNNANIEEALNRQRDAAELPPSSFPTALDAMYEICRGYRESTEALLQERKTSGQAYKDKYDVEMRQFTDKIASLETTISRKKANAEKREQECREAQQEAADSTRGYATSREKMVGDYREAIGVQKARLTEQKSVIEAATEQLKQAAIEKKTAAEDFAEEKKLLEKAVADERNAAEKALAELTKVKGEQEAILREKDLAITANRTGYEELTKLRKEVNELRGKHDESLREKDETQKKALEAIKGEFEKELAKLRDQLSAADQGTEILRLREEPKAASRNKIQLESEKAHLERQLTELRVEQAREHREIPLRLTPSSHEQQLPPTTCLAIPTFASALMGPPELTPSSRCRGSALENPKDKVLKPYISPYGSRAVSVFEDSDEETSASPVGFAGSLAVMPGPSSSSPSSAGSLAAIPGSASPAGGLAATPGLSSRAGGLKPIPPRAAAPVPVPGGASLGLLAAAGLVLSGVSPSSVSGGLRQLPASFAATPVSFLAGNSAAPSPALAAVGSPYTMPTPVEFVATGSLNNGELADTVSTSVLELTSAQIAEWRIKGGLLWMQPYSKKPFCVAVKISRVKTPKWPENSYYDPANDDPEFACPICLGNHSPCLWSRGGLLPQVLPLPPHARAPGATPETAGYYTTAVTE
ncbi:hypothetical protein V502_05546 [Pseudogymnoascus sp. VKM F-4520 (FW-2644)]|nr:hypothetical protein V502_05546 [Pseudogymnoascus sp. VKM F-4520 (FW-2644)]